MYLSHRWKTLWLRIPHRGEIYGFLNDLEAGYKNPFRAYHDLSFHVLHCLRELDGVITFCQNQEAVELALWFHDVHHDIYATDNEEISARYAMYCMGELKVSARFQEIVRDHILATKHASAPKHLDSQLVADIDLSIMGCPAHIWQEVQIRIALEYQHVPTQIFQTKRVKILRNFLDRDRIFLTDLFRDKYEVQARKNLEAAIQDVAEFTYVRFLDQYNKLDDFVPMDQRLDRW